MLYYDDYVQAAFHKMPTLLQVVCQTLESRLTEAHYQLKVLECYQTDEKFETVMSVISVYKEPELVVQIILEDAVVHTNQLFQRKDGHGTVTIDNAVYLLLTVMVTTSADLVQLT